MAHPPRIPVWLDAGQPVVYFLTICEKTRQAVWADEVFFAAFKAAVTRLVDERLWFVSAAVVMPDHLHLLASPLQDREQAVGNLSGALKRWTRQALTNPRWQWQTGSFDHLLRREESASEKWAYMRENPVRAGLIDHWEAWPWSIGIREPSAYL